jgi:LuxR family maltose regulon positive regulatory protein
LGLSGLLLEQNDAEAATEYLLRSEELGKQDASPHWRYRLCLAQARIKQAQGDLDGALALLDEAERLYVRTPVPDVCPIAALKARIWVAQGRLAEALGWAREQGLCADDDLSYLREFEHVTLARVLIAGYKSKRAERAILEAMGLLERLLNAAEAGGRMGSVIEILLLQALAYEAQGDTSRALAPLERALRLAEPEGYIRTFVNEGPPMAHLLSEAAARGMVADYIHKLLAAFASEEQKSENEASVFPAPLSNLLSSH